MTELELVTACVLRWFPPRRWAVCANVSWGFLSYEADAVAVSKSNRIHEIEAKISASDLSRDSRKRKWRQPPQTDYHWYVVQPGLADAATTAAAGTGSGVFVVEPPPEHGDIGYCKRIVKARPRRDVVVAALNRKRDCRNSIWRLASLRYWNQIVQRLRESNAAVKEPKA